MSERLSRSSVNLDVGVGSQPSHEIPDSDTPFRILIVGDFSGGLPGERAPLSGRRPKSVDCDNLDEVLASFAPSVQLPLAKLRFRSLDDFHPDHIYQNTDRFRKLADLRSQPAPVPASAIPAAAPSKSGRSLLEEIMERSDDVSTEQVAAERDGLAAFIKKAVEPHLEERRDPRQQEWAAKVDLDAGEQMRAILHDPHFQALEAAWRGVAMLIDRLQPDTELKLFVFDATLDEMMADPEALARCLSGSKDPWALIVGNFSFGQSDEDVANLHWLGQLASQLGAPFLGEAVPPSDETPPAMWQRLVHTPAAHWIGLALPRFLLRLPYGNDTSPAEQLAFEEMPQNVHAHYLWGNPAIFCACVYGMGFRESGWDLRPARHRQIANLPLHIHKADGESVCKPCAEILLTDHDAEFLMSHGIMALASEKNEDSVLLVRPQSIADPVAALSGRWSRG